MYTSSAHVYDLIYAGLGKDYAAEAAELRSLISGRAPGARSVLDVACGTGGHLVHLREWYEVTGVDAEPAMLEIARSRLPRTPLSEADMRSFDLERRFDAVVCLFSAIGHMRDVAGGSDAAIAAMAAHLTPVGCSSWTAGSGRTLAGVTRPPTSRPQESDAR